MHEPRDSHHRTAYLLINKAIHDKCNMMHPPPVLNHRQSHTSPWLWRVTGPDDLRFRTVPGRLFINLVMHATAAYSSGQAKLLSSAIDPLKIPFSTCAVLSLSFHSSNHLDVHEACPERQLTSNTERVRTFRYMVISINK